MIDTRSGKRYVVHQFSNDWITGDGTGQDQRQNVVLNPLHVQLETEAEILLFMDDQYPGIFWDLYTLDADSLTFARKT